MCIVSNKQASWLDGGEQRKFTGETRDETRREWKRIQLHESKIKLGERVNFGVRVCQIRWHRNYIDVHNISTLRPPENHLTPNDFIECVQFERFPSVIIKMQYIFATANVWDSGRSRARVCVCGDERVFDGTGWFRKPNMWLTKIWFRV